MSQLQMPQRAHSFSESGKNIQKIHKGKSQYDYKGITLKQYFRLQTEETYFQQQDKIVEQQEQSSCCENNVQTPAFKQAIAKNQSLIQPRRKIKTEVLEEQQLAYQKKNSNPVKICKNEEKNQSYIYIMPGDKSAQSKQLKYKSQNKKNVNKNSLHKQRIGSMIDSDPKKQDQNRSTLTSFYQQQKKIKMLKKIKQDKQKVKELQISDVFYITKYAKKFHMEANDVSN